VNGAGRTSGDGWRSRAATRFETEKRPATAARRGRHQPPARLRGGRQASACAEILPGGGRRRVGTAGGAPNGINMDTRGRIVIANYGIGTATAGPLQRLDPETGEVEVGMAGASDTPSTSPEGRT
jgi:hypothetical protein